MNKPAKALSESHDVSTKVAQMLQTRTKTAIERYGERVRCASERSTTELKPQAPVAPWQLLTSGARYAVDFAQRSILFWDTLRQRGNNFIEHERQGLPPVLHFEYEMVMDGRRSSAGQLRAGAHRAAAGRDGRCEAAALRHHRPARRPWPRHRRLQGRFAGRRRTARRPPGVLRHLLPEPRAGTDAARRVRGRTRVRSPRSRRCTPTAPSPPSSATARPAGRR